MELRIIRTAKQPEPDSFLFRYITIDKLLDFLICQRIPLIRLNSFEDKLEGVNLNHILLNGVVESLSSATAPWIGELAGEVILNTFPSRKDSLRVKREEFQDKNYATCWYISNYESIAMWKLYSSYDSVAIKIPFIRFSEVITNNEFEIPEIEYESLKYGAVTYHPYRNILDISKILQSKETQGFTKDLSFAHEKEFRLLLQTKNSLSMKVKKREMIMEANGCIIEPQNTHILYLKFKNFKEIPFEIVFHPQAYKWHINSIREILKKFDLDFKTYESNLKNIYS